MNSDERVFGAYGLRSQARDVLAQLLQGSGYNVIMIGDQGQGTPRQLLLSAFAHPRITRMLRQQETPGTTTTAAEMKTTPTKYTCRTVG